MIKYPGRTAAEDVYAEYVPGVGVVNCPDQAAAALEFAKITGAAKDAIIAQRIAEINAARAQPRRGAP